MQYLAIAVLTIGTLGIVFSKKAMWGMMHGRFAVMNSLVTLISFAGWILCIIAFGWKAIIPIVVSMIIGRMLVG